MVTAQPRGGAGRHRAQVSALAVALCIGIGVFTGAGDAWADPTADTEAASDAAEPSTPKAGGADGDAPGPDTVASTDSEPADSGENAIDLGDGVTIRYSGGADGDERVPGADASDEAEPQIETAVTDLQPAPVNDGADPPPRAVELAEPAGSARVHRSAPAVPEPQRPLPLVAGVDDTEAPAVQLFGTRIETSDTTPRASDAPVVTAAPVLPDAQAPSAVADAASTLLANVFNALWTPAPGAPVDSPVVWAVLALVRRQYNGSPTNATPALSTSGQDVDPHTPGEPDDARGVVRGALGIAGSPAGRPVTIALAEGGAPRYGTVEFDSATIAYSYTPNLAGRLRAGLAPLVDTFTVLIGHGDHITTVLTRDVPIAGLTLNVASDEIAIGIRPVGVAVSPDGARVFVTDAHTGGVYVLDTGGAHTDSATVELEPIVTGGYTGPNDYRVPDGGMAFSADGTLLYVSRRHAEIVAGLFMPAAGDVIVIGNDPADPDTYLKLIGAPIDAYAAALQLDGAVVGPLPSRAPLSSDGSVGYAVNAATGTISIIDVIADEKILDVTCDAVPRAGELRVLATSPDGSRLFIADDGGDTVIAVTLTRPNSSIA